jgi:hypothetical protein
MPRPKIRYRYPRPKARLGPPPTRAELTVDGRCDGVLHAQLPTPLLLEAERQAAHELKSLAAYVRAALLEKVLRDLDDQKDQEDAAPGRG